MKLVDFDFSGACKIPGLCPDWIMARMMQEMNMPEFLETRLNININGDMIMQLAKLTGLVMAFLAFSAFAGDFEEGLKFYDSQDYEKAAVSFRKAAEQGNAQAQLKMGMLYTNGQGVTADDQQAVSWYRKAADKKVAEAQFYLGVSYANGRGVAVDKVEADKWLTISGKAGFTFSKLFREFLEKNMTPGKVAEAQKQANAWMKAHP